jgi:MFS family permease
LSSIIPGAIVGANLHLALPGYGVVVPWRSAFLLCGMCGPVIGLLFFTVREPARRGLPPSHTAPPNVAEKLEYLWRQRRLIVPLFAGFCLYYTAFVGVASWTAPLLMRTFGLTLPQIANGLGLGMLIAGVAGYLLGGYAADIRMAGQRSGRIGLMVLLPILALPTAFAGLAPGIGLAIAAIATISLTTPMLNVAMNATVQEIVPNDMRGFSYAFLSVVAALPAGAGGPFAIAFVSQTILGDPSRIADSFICVVLPCLLLAAICFALAARAYRSAPADGELARVIGASHQ